MKFTPLYEFTVSEKLEKEVQKTKTIDGQEVKVLEKETIEKPVKILFKKPGRRDEEVGQRFYHKKVHELMKDGVMTHAMIVNKYKDTGGFISQEMAKEYGEKILKYVELEKEIALLEALKKNSAKQKEKLESMKAEYAELYVKINEFNEYKNSLLSNSADKLAEEELIRWYMLNFFFVQRDDEDEPEPYFKGESHEDKLDSYYSLEDEGSSLHQQIAPEMGSVLGAWLYTKARQPEDFKKAVEELKKLSAEKKKNE